MHAVSVMAANFVKKIFRQGTGHSAEENDGVREEEEGATRSTRFADTADPVSPSTKKKGKKEVRVQEPASEDGEQQKAKATSVKKSAEKKGPPSVSCGVKFVGVEARMRRVCFFYVGCEEEDQ